MPRTRRTLVFLATSCVAIAAGVFAAEFLPPAYLLFGVSRPVAVTLLGFAPVVVVAVSVGCVLAYRKLFASSATPRVRERKRISTR